MELFVLMAQRKERYPGEYAPEALAVIEGAGQDENPDYMAEKLGEARKSEEFENAVVVQIRIDEAKVMQLLRTHTAALTGSVIA